MNKPPLKILVIDDEAEIREIVIFQFQKAGATAMGLPSGDNLMRTLKTFNPNLILLDQLLPGQTGREIIQKIRSSIEFCEIPIIMVTGVLDEASIVLALDSGADDYVTKPFSPNELICRAKSLIRRSTADYKSQQPQLASKFLTVNFLEHKVILYDREIQLTLTEYKMLSSLMKQNGKTVSRDELRKCVFKSPHTSNCAMDVHLSSLRRKLGNLGKQIVTIHGLGFRMEL